MRALLDRVPDLRAAVAAIAEARNPDDAPRLMRRAEALVLSFASKCRHADHHKETLGKLAWDELRYVGHQELIDHELKPRLLRINSPSMAIFVHDLDAAMDFVLMTFEGAVSCIVNATDTLSRLVNLMYDLALPERRVSLAAIRDRLDESCPAHRILKDTPGLEWLARLKDIRGECQHADIATILEFRHGVGEPLREPILNDVFGEGIPLAGRTATAYVGGVSRQAVELMSQLIAVMARDPSSALVVRSVRRDSQ